jgi:hypothetical protein
MCLLFLPLLLARGIGSMAGSIARFLSVSLMPSGIHIPYLRVGNRAITLMLCLARRQDYRTRFFVF